MDKLIVFNFTNLFISILLNTFISDILLLSNNILLNFGKLTLAKILISDILFSFKLNNPKFGKLTLSNIVIFDILLLDKYNSFNS